MTVRDVDLSRAVSHALRHEPWLYELELDEEGWAQVEQLVSALREKGENWSAVDRKAIERMIMSATKRRHELDGNRIRALYGHSAHRIKKATSRPPGRLFHGTAPRTWDLIQEEGLRPMGRQHVHLSIDVATATAVGRRKSAHPVILTIDATGAAAAGARFYKGNDIVWLADQIPATSSSWPTSRSSNLAGLAATQQIADDPPPSAGGHLNTSRRTASPTCSRGVQAQELSSPASTNRLGC